MKKLMLALLPLALAIPATSAAAKARIARCVIASAGSPTWRGPCWFEAERGGSFNVGAQRGNFGGEVESVSVSIIAPGVAEVRGLTSAGINSRWGEARRSRRDGACWIGSDFSICVY